MAELEERAIECSRSVESKPKYVSEAAENIPWDELEQIVLRLSPRSRRNAVEAFKSWLIRIREASERGESGIFVLNGEWGVGKTALGKTVLRSEAEKFGYKVKEIRFDVFINDIKKNYNRYGIIEDYLSLFENTLREYLQEVGNISEENPLLLFIDEVEGIIGLYHRQETIGDVNAGHAFIQFLREFRSKDSRFAPDLKGKIHLVLFITPFALNFITRQLGPEYSGWLLRRESIYNLYPLDKYETIEFTRESLK
ncbi:MAG: AAA family ATPase, partial [Desulfurococcaceae archaeon]